MGNSWTVVVWKLSKRPKTGVSPTRGYDSDCGRLSWQKIDLAICFLAYHDSERLICSFFPRCLCMKNPAHRLLRIWPEIAGYMVASCSLSLFIVLMVATAMMLSTSIAHFHVAKPFQNVTWDLPKSGHYAHQCVNCWTSKTQQSRKLTWLMWLRRCLHRLEPLLQSPRVQLEFCEMLLKWGTLWHCIFGRNEHPWIQAIWAPGYQCELPPTQCLAYNTPWML